jgi:hypothetical protein
MAKVPEVVIQSRAEVPIKWEEAVAACAENTLESLSRLGRNESQTSVYRAVMAEVRPAAAAPPALSSVISFDAL